MKAIVHTKYGSPDLLQLKEVEKPAPKDNEILVKVHASAVNDWDLAFTTGKPYLLRAMVLGLRKPKVSILGVEVAGTVEAVGDGVESFQVGDEVYGDISEAGFGGFAEFVCVNENALAHKPPTMSFEEAASIPHAAMLATQGLLDIGKLQERADSSDKLKLLINGAGGGVGTFGIQIAKLYSAEVTGVDSIGKLEMMQSIGFDHVIDYKREDFTKNGQQYDLILDTKTNRSPWAYLRSLAPGGTYITVGGQLGRLFQVLAYGVLISRFTKKRLRIVALKPNKDLTYINELYESGKLTCVMDAPFHLSEVPEAVKYFGEAKHKGKVIIRV